MRNDAEAFMAVTGMLRRYLGTTGLTMYTGEPFSGMGQHVTLKVRVLCIVLKVLSGVGLCVGLVGLVGLVELVELVGLVVAVASCACTLATPAMTLF